MLRMPPMRARPVPWLSTGAIILTSAGNAVQIVAIATTCFEPCREAVYGGSPAPLDVPVRSFLLLPTVYHS